ncbi:CCHC-type zinc finger transcription factor [Phycomyces blakesleeanus]
MMVQSIRDLQNMKRRQKSKKLDAKRKGSKGQQLENIFVCFNCHQSGHESSQSKECPNHNSSKQKEVQALLGNYTSITKKIKLETILKPEYQTLFKEKVRQLLTKEFLRRTFGTVSHSSFKRTQSQKAMPSDCFTFWETFSSRYNVAYDMTPVSEYSHRPTAACIKTATVYTSNINESIYFVYYYEAVRKRTPVWPDELPEVYNNKKPAIKDICTDFLSTDMPRYNGNKKKKHDEEDEEKSQMLPRLFSLCPVTSLKWRFITLNPNPISAFAGISLPVTYEGKYEMFSKIFDFKRLRLSSFQDLKYPNKKTKSAVSNVIRTGGYVADVIINKSSQTNTEDFTHYSDQNVLVTLLGDVLTSEGLDNTSICAIDPNCNQVSTASYGDCETNHQLRRCSTKEYYTYTGSKRHTKKK